MKLIWFYLKKYRTLLFATIGVKLLGTLGELSLPYILEYMIDEVAPTKSLGLTILLGVVMVILAWLTRAFNINANRKGANIARLTTYEIRRDLFCRSINLSGSRMDEFGLPSITSRMTSDSYNIQSFVRSILTMGIRAPILLFGGIALTMTMDVALAAILGGIAVLVIVTVVFISAKGIPLFDRVQALLDKVVRVMRENITGIWVVKALSKEKYETERFSEANGDLTKAERTANIVMSLPGPVMSFFLNVGLTLVVFVGAYRVNDGFTKPGVILAFLTYFNLILNGAMGLNRIFTELSKANASANRIGTVIEAPDDLAPISESLAAVSSSNSHIVFENVTFSYGKKDTSTDALHFDGGIRQNSLENITFEIPRGGSLGIIGATGCGKTTVINLLMRFYDTTSGHIFVDGKDIRTYKLDDLRRKFGVVFQNDVIFADTISENIRFGRDVSDEELEQAANDACASEFIERYDDRYQHQAAIHGANFSGGQKQRLLISRALAAKPEILVLDDSSSALDYKTDAALRRSIREHHSDSTTIVIAQRISSIMYSDRIMMLEDGKIIGYGTHSELMANCPAYGQIYEAQMGDGN